MTPKIIAKFALGPIGSAIFGFITLPIITWFYSIEDVGKVSMLQVVSSLTILFFCLGLDQAYAREYHEAKDKPRLFKHVFFPGFILLLFSFAVIYLIDEVSISRWLYEENSQYLTIISLMCFIFAYCSRFLSLILRMQERPIAYSMSQLLPKVFFLIFILFIVWFGFNNDLYHLTATYGLSILIVFLVFAWNTRFEWISSIKKDFSLHELLPLLQFGLPLVIGGLAAWGLKVVDKLFLRSLSTFSELGIYSVAISIAGVATIFSGVFNTIWAPLVYKWVSEKTIDNKVINEIFEHMLAAVYFVIVLSGLFSWLIPYLLPKEYVQIQYLITLCLFSPLLYTLSEVSSVGIAIVKKTKYSMYTLIIAMVFNIVGNYYLVPSYGATGAAVSTAFSFWIFYIIKTELSRKIWIDIHSLKAYIIITILLFFSILNVIALKSSLISSIIWMSLFFIGIFLFKKSFKVCMRKIGI